MDYLAGLTLTNALVVSDRIADEKGALLVSNGRENLFDLA
jgi:hypothetical protein